MQIKRGLIVGRFQPYHFGHHVSIKKIIDEVDEIVIVVGSSKESHSRINPFTAGERIEMIVTALKNDKIYEKCFVIPIPDVNHNALWVAQVKGMSPKFDVVYTNNPLVKQLFEVDGFEIKAMVSGLPGIDSTTVRDSMFKSKGWKEKLPGCVADYLVSIKATKRIKAILETEEKK